MGSKSNRKCHFLIVSKMINVAFFNRKVQNIKVFIFKCNITLVFFFNQQLFTLTIINDNVIHIYRFSDCKLCFIILAVHSLDYRARKSRVYFILRYKTCQIFASLGT